MRPFVVCGTHEAKLGVVGAFFQKLRKEKKKTLGVEHVHPRRFGGAGGRPRASRSALVNRLVVADAAMAPLWASVRLALRVRGFAAAGVLRDGDALTNRTKKSVKKRNSKERMD
jgi:hypothetical protein